jgi:uracil-DNA glycosylase
MSAKILRNDWERVLGQEFAKPYYLELRSFLKEQYASQQVYPDKAHLFNALHFTPYSAVKVVIIGQDPYHGAGQAHGLCFSVQPGIAIPPSLQNIFKELQNDIGCPPPRHGCLESWARQGVLLLNAVLSVREGEPNSHRGKGWENFTDRIIQALNERSEPVAFILWGSHAQAKGSAIDAAKHLILRSPHPSPLSAHRGFFGSRPFSHVNEWLRQLGQAEIDWKIPEEERINP